VTQGANRSLGKILDENAFRAGSAANIRETQKGDTVPIFLFAWPNVFDSERDTGCDLLILGATDQLELLSILCAPARLTSAKNIVLATDGANKELPACMV
jgi:hypothetical protein